MWPVILHFWIRFKIYKKLLEDGRGTRSETSPQSHRDKCPRRIKETHEFYKIHTCTKLYIHMNTCPHMCTFSVKHKMQNNFLNNLINKWKTTCGARPFQFCPYLYSLNEFRWPLPSSLSYLKCVFEPDALQSLIILIASYRSKWVGTYSVIVQEQLNQYILQK